MGLEAALRLKTHSWPKALAVERDENGDSALSWACYRAGHSTAAVELIRTILNIVPSEVNARSSMCGFTALHDAAWGNASQSVANVLCTAYPPLVAAKSATGETAYQVGTYHHGRRFGWPFMQFNAVGAESDEARQAPHILSASGECVVSSSGPSQPRWRHGRHVHASCPRSTPVRRGLSDAENMDIEDSTVTINTLSGMRSKERGKFAGAAKVRNRRCSFLTTGFVAVNNVLHRFELHCSLTVHSSVQHAPVEPKWPYKMHLKRERAQERLDKCAVAVLSCVAGD